MIAKLKVQPGGTERFQMRLPPGSAIEVRSRFQGDWVRGFVVFAVDARGYRLRRLSDQSVLPIVFTDDDVRPLDA